MKKAKTLIETKIYIICPHCQQDKIQIDHLFDSSYYPRNFGPWFCDKCGQAYRGVVKENNEVFVEPIDKKRFECITFLKHNDILIAVEDFCYDNEIDQEGKRYFFEEHTCPENYFRSTKVVFDLKLRSADPHGLFKYIATIDKNKIDLDSLSSINNISIDDFIKKIEQSSIINN